MSASKVNIGCYLRAMKEAGFDSEEVATAFNEHGISGTVSVSRGEAGDGEVVIPSHRLPGRDKLFFDDRGFAHEGLGYDATGACYSDQSGAIFIATAYGENELANYTLSPKERLTVFSAKNCGLPAEGSQEESNVISSQLKDYNAAWNTIEKISRWIGRNDKGYDPFTGEGGEGIAEASGILGERERVTARPLTLIGALNLVSEASSILNELLKSDAGKQAAIAVFPDKCKVERSEPDSYDCRTDDSDNRKWAKITTRCLVPPYSLDIAYDLTSCVETKTDLSVSNPYK